MVTLNSLTARTSNLRRKGGKTNNRKDVSPPVVVCLRYPYVQTGVGRFGRQGVRHVFGEWIEQKTGCHFYSHSFFSLCRENYGEN